MRVATVFAGALFAATTAHAGVTWETSFEKARATALREGKLLFIDFYADW